MLSLLWLATSLEHRVKSWISLTKAPPLGNGPLRKYLKILFLSIASIAIVFGCLAFWALRHSFPPKPALAGRLEQGRLEEGGRMRTWIAYRPAKLAEHPALVIVLHGSMGTAEQVRAEFFGYDFDRLADQFGFVAVYPQGYQGQWNDCRVKGPFAAKQMGIDDVGFLRALVDRLAKSHQADPIRVYVAGVSNGGSMALRVAFQAPDLARAYAIVGASVPVPGNMAVTPKNQAVSLLIMNGTDDPFNPWRGGDVVLRGVWGNRGAVLSTQASIDHFRRLAGLDGAPRLTQFPDRDPSDGSVARRSLWSAPGKRSVALYTIDGGGHNVPHPAMYGMRLLGNSNRDIHAAGEIWEFFRSAP